MLTIVQLIKSILNQLKLIIDKSKLNWFILEQEITIEETFWHEYIKNCFIKKSQYLTYTVVKNSERNISSI